MGRRRGRPSRKLVDQAVSEGVLEEFVRRGFHAMGMESIARPAGVIKLSLYRRCPSKRAVTEEAFRILRDRKPPEDRGSCEADIRSPVRQATGSRGTKTALSRSASFLPVRILRTI